MKNWRVKIKAVVCFAALGAALIFTPGLVGATTVIDFSGQGGTVDVGLGITGALDYQTVEGTNTPLHSGISDTCIGCVMDFSTLTHTFTLFGDVPAAPGAFPVLATGTISSFSFAPTGIDDINILTMTGSDHKNPDLLEYFGLPANQSFAGFTFSTDVRLVDGVWTAVSNDFANTAVPEPGSVLLLGSGLFGLGAWQWRRLQSREL